MKKKTAMKKEPTMIQLSKGESPFTVEVSWHDRAGKYRFLKLDIGPSSDIRRRVNARQWHLGWMHETATVLGWRLRNNLGDTTLWRAPAGETDEFEPGCFRLVDLENAAAAQIIGPGRPLNTLIDEINKICASFSPNPISQSLQEIWYDTATKAHRMQLAPETVIEAFANDCQWDASTGEWKWFGPQNAIGMVRIASLILQSIINKENPCKTCKTSTCE